MDGRHWKVGTILRRRINDHYYEEFQVFEKFKKRVHVISEYGYHSSTYLIEELIKNGFKAIHPPKQEIAKRWL